MTRDEIASYEPFGAIYGRAKAAADRRPELCQASTPLAAAPHAASGRSRRPRGWSRGLFPHSRPSFDVPIESLRVGISPVAFGHG
jgi:hypothetical protein